MSFFVDPSLATADVVDTTSSVATEAVTSHINSTAGILNEYGPSITILALFIVVFIGLLIFFARYFKKMMDKILDEKPHDIDTESIIRKTVNDCVSEVMQINKNSIIEGIEESVKKEKDSHKNIVSVYIDSEKVFKDASNRAMKAIKCQRIAIYLFHNGNRTPYGYPFAKMTCVHEMTNKGSYLTPRGHSHTNIPLYIFSELIESLNDNGEYIVDNVKAVINGEETQLGTFVQGDHVESVFAASIKNQDECLVSFTIAEFHDKQDFSDEEKLEVIRDALHDMNHSIYHIVVNDEFVDNFQ